jgi:hypothetical protein
MQPFAGAELPMPPLGTSATVSPVTALRAATQSVARSTHLERTKLRNFMLFLALK